MCACTILAGVRLLKLWRKSTLIKKLIGGVADPSGKPDEEFITVIKEIERKVLDLIEEVKEWENN